MSVVVGMPRVRNDARVRATPNSHDQSARSDRRPDSPLLVDRFERVATDLRVSLTDRCNLRCSYCMPAEGLPVKPRDELMSASEIVRLVRIAVTQLGAQHVRFTGGEPLLRADLADIIRGCAPLGAELSLTTNGVGLAERAAVLKQAGLQRLNVSLDSLDHETALILSRRPLLDRTLAGISAAQGVGFTGIKINAVLVRDVNDRQAADLLAWSLERGVELRFIEQMPLDADRGWERDRMVTANDIRELLDERFSLVPHPAPRDGAPAERYSVFAKEHRPGDNALGVVGIIASVTEPFCADCRRTRLTAEGSVRSCLFSHEEVSLLDSVRGGAPDAHIAELWRDAMWRKPRAHGVDDETEFRQPERTMSAIGG